MKTLITLLLFASSILAAQPVCNVSNAQINGYVLTATSTGGKLCAWQAPTGGGGGGAVLSVFGRTGAVVANTGDYSVAQITGAASLLSPHFTGVPTAPTAAPGNNTTQLATTAFVVTAIGGGGCPTCLLGTPANHGLVLSSATQTTNISGTGSTGQPFLSGGASADGAYGALNLAGGSSIVTGILPALNLPTGTAAGKGVLQGDGSTLTISAGVISCTTATTSQIGCLKPDGTSVTIAGGVISVAAGFGAVSSVFTRTGNVVANTGDYTVSQVTGAAPLASPALSGTPTSTTPGGGDNSTRIATTAFVVTAIAGISTGVTSFNTRTGAVTPAGGDYSVGQVTGAAPLASPALTGVPTSPTASPGTNTTQVATTAFVAAAVSSGPVTSVFGRTGVVAATSGDYSVGQVTGAAPLASPTFSGVPAGPTAAPGTNTTQLATTAFVTAALPSVPVSSVFGRTGAVAATSGDYSVAQVTGAAPIASPSLTGIPAAPTAAPGTNTTQIATTAFVTAAVVGGGGASIAHTLHIISGDNAGNGIDSGIAVGTLCGGCAASVDLPAGTPTGSVPSNTFRWEAPAVVTTAYAWHPPSADLAGFLHSNGSGQLDIVSGFTFSGGVLSTATVNATTAFTLNSIPTDAVYFGGSSSLFSNHSATSTSATQGTSYGSGAGLASLGNTAIGYQALNAVSTGNYNTGLGTAAGGATSGSNNTFLGHGAGQQNTTACTFVGDNAIATGAFTDCMALGRNTSVSASFRVVIGDGSVTDVFFGSESALATLHCANCGGGSGGVTSFNSRTGAVNLLNTDVNALAPITLGSTIYTGATALSTISAGGLNNSDDRTPHVSLIGGATSAADMLGYFHPPSEGLVREGAIVGGSLSSSSDTNWETDGIIAMSVARNTLGFGAGGNNVSLSGFAASIVNNGVAFGMNLLVQDVNRKLTTCSGQYLNACHYPSTLLNEIDGNVWDTGSTLDELNFGVTYLNGHTTGTDVTHAISINQAGSNANNYFDTAIRFNDGSANVAMLIGLAPGGFGTNSQFVNYRSGTSGAHLLKTYATSAGYYVVQPDTGSNSNRLLVSPIGDVLVEGNNFSLGTNTTLINGVLPGSVTGTALAFNAQNVAGTYKALTTGNRSAYFDMTNNGIDLVITPGTQTAGASLSGAVMALSASINGVITIPASSFIFNGHTCTIVATVVTCP